jgi:hypothetical protein
MSKLKQVIELLNRLKMEELKSYLEISVDDEGFATARVIKGTFTIPDEATPITEEVYLEDGFVYNFYHRPDCAWFTKLNA